MPTKPKPRSCGLLLFRRGAGLEVFLVHPGGPFWAKKDLGAWSIPKGEPSPGEDDEAAARRELEEETGFVVDAPVIVLGELVQPSGKTVVAFAAEQDCDPSRLRSNTCFVEWPPRSGRQLEIPEVDRGEWFSVDVAAEKLSKGQRPFLDRLTEHLARRGA